jgi:outer membrane scaffolding protein for murein synthesis (MipA/OmpV family)
MPTTGCIFKLAARRLALGAVLVLLSNAAFGQLSEEPSSDAPALWEFRLAAFGRYTPTYPGADEHNLTLLPIPIPVYRGNFLNFGENLDQLARGDVLDTSRIKLGIDLDFSFGQKSSDIAVRNGMPDLDFMLELGPELEIKLDNRTPAQGELLLAFQLRAAASFDGLSPKYQGFLFNPQLEYRREQVFNSDTLLSLRWMPTWASEDFMDYYYEVEPAFATLQRPAYDAAGGYLGSRFTVALTRQITERLIFGVSTSLFVNNGAENEPSPLYRRDSGASIQAAFIWTLAESERRSTR